MTSGTNGTVTSLTEEVLRYAAGVRAELADLPPDQRDDLLEDLEDHLSEVAAELDESLESRLGSPETYAAELRASAGLAPAETVGQRRRPGVVRATSRLWNSGLTQALRGFLPELQPAWWVLRGLVVAVVLSMLVGVFAGVVVGIAVVIASVMLGRRTRGWRGPWPLAVAVNVLAAIAGIVVLAAVTSEASTDPKPTTTEQVFFSRALAHEDGRPITNIFPYDAQGQPLSGVRLYDQDGRPITNVSNVTEDGRLIERTYPVEANGLRVRNAYPQELVIIDRFGGPPTRVPAVPPTPSPSVSPSISPVPPG